MVLVFPLLLLPPLFCYLFIFSPACTLVTPPFALDGEFSLVRSFAVSSFLSVYSPADVAATAGFLSAQSAVSPPAVLN